MSLRVIMLHPDPPFQEAPGVVLRQRIRRVKQTAAILNVVGNLIATEYPRGPCSQTREVVSVLSGVELARLHRA